MRNWFSVVPMLLVAASAPAQPLAPPPPPAEAAANGPAMAYPTAAAIPSGTPLYVRLDETVSTKGSKPGDIIHATLYQPVVVQGRTKIPAGTRFTGRVTVVDESGRLTGRGHITLVLDSFQLNGRTYHIETAALNRATSSHKKRNLGLIGGGAGFGGLLGAVAGGGPGALIGGAAGAVAGTGGAALTGKKNITIPAETQLQFTLQAPVRM